MNKALSDDARTTPVGLYHYGRSYRGAATTLVRSKLAKKVTHPDAPRDYLFIHAIELYLKAYLRNRGVTVAQLRKLSHNFQSLAQEYEKHDGFLMDEDKDVLALLTAANVLGARYIVTGAFTRATTKALARTAKSLHETVRDALRESGHVCGS